MCTKKLLMVVISCCLLMMLPPQVRAVKSNSQETCCQSSKPIRTPFYDSVTGLYGYKDGHNRIVILPQFCHASAFSEYGVANVVIRFQATADHTKEASYFCRINEHGHILEQAFFSDNGWDYYEEGLARYVHNGKVGFSDERGEHVIQACFDMALAFRNGVAPVCSGGKQRIAESYPCRHNDEWVEGQWGVIDKKGTLLVPLTHKSFIGALKAFYLSDLAPENSWVETHATITAVSYDAQGEVWHYEFESDDGQYTFTKGVSKHKLCKGQRMRIKYVAKDVAVWMVIG